MKQFIAPFAVLAFSLLGALLGAPSANAGTMDDHYSKVGQISVHMSSSPTCQNIDVTNDWASYILNAEKWDTNPNIQEAYINQKLSFEIAMQNGSWGVSEEVYPDNSNPTQKQVWVYWRESGQISLNWYQGYGIEVYHEDLHVVAINCENTAVPTARPNYPFQSAVVSRSNGLVRNYFVNNAVLNMPSDYNGDFVRDTDPSTPSGGATIDEKPRVKMDTLVEWKASFSDQNFYTIDNPPFLCGDDFPPRLNLELWDKSLNNLVLSDVVSANSKLDYTFPNVTHNVEYEIVSWYSCTDGTLFVEPGASFYSFVIDRNGSLVNLPNVEACMTEEYPFVHMDGCLANMSVVTEALSFGSVKVGATNQWSFTDGCHQLGTVGEWINLEGQSVCPNIPASVRNVITPFITFAMGLMTVKFITKQGGNSL